MTQPRPTVLVLYGGRSSEHAISCVSAGSILAAIDSAAYDVLAVGITTDGAWVRQAADPAELVIRDGVLPRVDPAGAPVRLSLDPREPGVLIDGELHRVDIVFPVLHGPFGEDGTIQGLLEIAGLPYVGSGVLASAACMDKAMTKRVLGAEGVPAGRWQALHHHDWGEDTHAAVVGGLGWPVFVKPARAGSSMGVSKVHDAAALDAAVAAAAAHDPQLIIEAAVPAAREIECGVLVGRDGVPRASIPAEIRVRSGHEFYDFEAKYLDDSCDLLVPAPLDAATTARIQDLAVRVFRAMGCAGLARVDFFIDGVGTVSVNEVNTMPGFTPISMFPRMWAAAGVSYPELVATLLAGAGSGAVR